jgi:signal transduction histidine kinase
MRQRAEAFGGRLDIESQVGGGTRVRVEIPIARQ